MDIKSHTDRVMGFVRGGNYHAALNIALSGLNACRKNNDQAGVDRCLSLIKGVTVLLAQEYGSKETLVQRKNKETSCLICGASGDMAIVLSEAHDAICGQCAAATQNRQ
ncbi:MAG: hypothetical protein BMS9Abin36_1257 [Gammaproteobacteria bacterium]|nr:MAG: hypothetical protein BMS9Abin36_1257 [Gammaproteobacteria bacterium]